MTISVEDVDASSNIFMCLYGDIAIGKTTFIGSGGKDYKILIVRPKTDHVDAILGSGVKQIIVRDWGEISEASDYVRHEGHNYDWVWFDSITLMQDMGLRDVYADVVESKGGRASKRARFGPDRGEYRVNMWRLEETISDIVSTGGFNFGITAHAMWYEPDERSEDVEPYLMPMIHGTKGNFAIKIAGMMNVVGYMNQVKRRSGRGGEEKLVRAIHLNKTPGYYAKNQFNLPNGEPPFPGNKIYSPTLPAFMEGINKCRVQATASRPARGRRPAAASKRSPARKSGAALKRTTRR